MITYLRERKHYEEAYDRETVREGMQRARGLGEVVHTLLDKTDDEQQRYAMQFWHVRFIWWFVEIPAGERWEKRSDAIAAMMEADAAKDERIKNARLRLEPRCEHCGAHGLRLRDKYMVHRGKFDEILFMLTCSTCKKKTTVWEDGTTWESPITCCPKCNAAMTETVTESKRFITSRYSCDKCGHAYKNRIDMSARRAQQEEDPQYEAFKKELCITTTEQIDRYYRLKGKFNELLSLLDEDMQKEANKELLTALTKIKKLTIPQVMEKLRGEIEAAGYIEVSFDKPSLASDIVMGFNCMDEDANRDDYKSRGTLKQIINEVLANTNWRLMSDGISYRLGYLDGRLRAYETEAEILTLVGKRKKVTELSPCQPLPCAYG